MSNSTDKRAPIVAIMGHVDHGKSTLLDYIRKTNVVAGEAGGITQHLSAYEVQHTDDQNNVRSITFLDTPGHEAFTKMRMRGAKVADIAILIVSAEDGVKQQTIEAYTTIQNEKMPFIVAINKIDAPSANIEKTKISLSEHEIYIEGFGGTIPCVEISAKEGLNIEELLTTILLVADIEEFVGDKTHSASGIVIESHTDPKSGISATLIIKNGTLTKGEFVVAGNALCPTRMLSDFTGKSIDSASFSSPVQLTGWNTVPPVGAIFETCKSKKESEKALEQLQTQDSETLQTLQEIVSHTTKIIPLIIKTDVAGTFEALDKQICKLQTPEIAFKIIKQGVGDISEADISLAIADKETIIVGFNVSMDKNATDLNMTVNADVQTSDIIYEIIEWLEKERNIRKPKVLSTNVHGSLKILRIFSSTKNKYVLGGEIQEGQIQVNDTISIKRRDEEIGTGLIKNIQQNKVETTIVKEGQCGLMLETKTEIAQGDVLEAFTMIEQ